MPTFPEFGEFFIGYGSYHWNNVNKMIHIICIPLILSSLLAMINHTDIVLQTPMITNPLFSINLSLLSVIILSYIYISVDLITGLISTVFYLGHWVLNNYLYQLALDNKMSNFHFKVALGIHLICWIAQFIGHGVYEKRAPALLDNLAYTLVAPDFVIIEIMFELGYKKEVFEKCKKQIQKNVDEFQHKRSSDRKTS